MGQKSPIASPRWTPASPVVDERELWAAQAAVGVLLLGAFVFRMPELVYVVTVVVGVGALLGTGGRTSSTRRTGPSSGPG